MKHPTSPDHDCICGLLAAGFDSFEFYIPFPDDRPYLVTLWRLRHTTGLWAANVRFPDDDYIEIVKSEGTTAAEALWNLKTDLASNPWRGDPSALPDRLVLLAALLWADATAKTAEEYAAAARSAAQTAQETAADHARAVADCESLAQHEKAV